MEDAEEAADEDAAADHDPGTDDCFCGTLALPLATVQPMRSLSGRGSPGTLRRPRAPPNARDALLFPATVPSGI